jgi:MFS family permease
VIPLAKGIPAIAVTMALFGVGHGFVFPAASSLVSRDAPPAQVGVVTGLFYAVLVAGVAVGAPLMGAVGDATSPALAIWASSWFAFLGIPFVVRALFAPSPVPRADPAPAEDAAEP